MAERGGHAPQPAKRVDVLSKDARLASPVHVPSGDSKLSFRRQFGTLLSRVRYSQAAESPSSSPADHCCKTWNLRERLDHAAATSISKLVSLLRLYRSVCRKRIVHLLADDGDHRKTAVAQSDNRRPRFPLDWSNRRSRVFDRFLRMDLRTIVEILPVGLAPTLSAVLILLPLRWATGVKWSRRQDSHPHYLRSKRSASAVLGYAGENEIGAPGRICTHDPPVRSRPL